MYKENLNALFNEYKKCIQGNILKDLDKDDIPVKYLNKCLPQRQEIHNYVNSQMLRIFELDHDREHKLDGLVDKDVYKFSEYGWSEKRVRNM
jgi:hypothetical protein